MSRGRSSDQVQCATLDWRPTASLSALRRRARLLAEVREFFAARDVMEVETPLLQPATVTDPHIRSASCELTLATGGNARRFFLQTSPEFAMKRLLCAGSGSIFQICKAFRAGEQGPLHNAEFTMLEWYRIGFDHLRLMDEVDDLLRALLGCGRARRQTYAAAFREVLDLDPHRAALDTLRASAAGCGLSSTATSSATRDDLLDFLVAARVAPQLGRGRPTLLFDYPGSKAALAQTRCEVDGVVIAERFEAYYEGVELANGFHELRDGEEQRRRFEADLDERARCGLESVPLDERFVAALENGLPKCAGVALGLDRLQMVAAGAKSLKEVLTWTIDRI